MTRFLIGFGLGVASMLGMFIVEEYLENASLRDEGVVEPTLVWTAPGEMAATT